MTFTQKTPGKERTRGPNLAVFIASCGAIMEETLCKAVESGLVIASNKRLSQALESDERRDIEEGVPCWTGTMTAYDKPEQKLGKIIEYTDSVTSVRYIFPVPEEQQGKKNVLLVAEHPIFSLVKDGNDRIVQAVEVDIVENFPASKEGWFRCDPRYDIPQGKNDFSGNQDVRYLWRTDKRVGLVIRGDNDYYYDGYYRSRVVNLKSRASSALGVTVEAASADVANAPLRMREEDGKLIVEGTPEQIAAAARLLEGLKKG